MSNLKDFNDRFDAAKDEVLGKTYDLLKESYVLAYRKCVEFVNESQGLTLDDKEETLITVTEEFAKNLFRAFANAEKWTLSPVIRAEADSVAKKYGIDGGVLNVNSATCGGVGN